MAATNQQLKSRQFESENDKSIALKNEVFNALKETLSASSIHSIPNIINNKFVSIKYLWFICLLASSGLCAWNIYNTIMDYLNYDVVTMIDIVYQNSLIFPIISICNLNPFKTSESRTFLLNRLNQKFNFTYYYPQGPIITVLTDAKLFPNRTKFGFSIYDIFLSCQFNTKTCDFFNDFETYYDVNYGNCFRYNSGKNMNNSQIPQKYSFRKGVLNSLQLELWTGSAKENYDFHSYQNGLSIFINNESLDSSSFEGIKISPGFSTDIIISKYSITKKPQPYSNCIGDLTKFDSYKSDCYKKAFSPNEKYHYTTCSDVCLQKYLGDTCKCQFLYLSKVYYANMPDCFVNMTVWNCFILGWYNFTESVNILKECDCPLECSQSGYTWTSSFAEFPTQNYVYYLANNGLINYIYPNRSVTFDALRSNIARVNIYYDDLKETEIRHEIKSKVADVIGQCGGILGLFLGISFLSIIEIFEIFIQTFFIVGAYSKQRVGTDK